MEHNQTKAINKKKYLPRFKRVSEEKPPLRLQARDREILKLVYDYRFLTSHQIQLLAHGSDQVILRRLQKLFHHRYLDRIFNSIYEKTIYALDNEGADVLVHHTDIDRGKIDWAKKNREVRTPYLNHTLMIGNFRIALSLAIKNSGPELCSWVPEGDQLRDGVVIQENEKKVKVPFSPDAYFVIKEQDKYLNFFLEADQSTMTNERFLRKMRAYWHFYKQEKHQQKFGINSFRVLTITKSKARAENLRKTAQRADDKQTGSLMFWFASEENYNPEKPETVLGPIWQTPKDETRHHLLE